jgi:hypothetical protein
MRGVYSSPYRVYGSIVYGSIVHGVEGMGRRVEGQARMERHA